MYHLFYQFPIAIPGGHGPVIGHVASRDMVRWTRLPVALWNDKYWDRDAVYTGSATIVNGRPVLLYPGKCARDQAPGCSTGFNYAIALPANMSDPFLRSWTKPVALNPLLNGTGDDPSTAWRTNNGEWRLIGNEKAISNSAMFAPIFSAPQISGPWSRIGLSPFAGGECPSLFPLPALYPGTERCVTGALPTHVHKVSRNTQNCSGDCSGDTMQLGTWVDGMKGDVGSWEPTGGVSFDRVVVDQGNRYASKDFLDIPHGRRISYGWSHIEGQGHTLPRVVTYDPRQGLQRLIHSSLPELSKLRETLLANTTRTVLKPQQPVHIFPSGNGDLGVGNSSELMVSFSRPSGSARFSAHVLLDEAGALESGIEVFVEYKPPEKPGGLCEVVVGTNPGCDGCNSATETLTLLASESEIHLRIFVDRKLLECYWMDGRVALTVGLPSVTAPPQRGGVALSSTSTEVETSATLWEMGSIWATQAEVLATPRPEHVA